MIGSKKTFKKIWIKIWVLNDIFLKIFSNYQIYILWIHTVEHLESHITSVNNVLSVSCKRLPGWYLESCLWNYTGPSMNIHKYILEKKKKFSWSNKSLILFGILIDFLLNGKVKIWEKSSTNWKLNIQLKCSIVHILVMIVCVKWKILYSRKKKVPNTMTTISSESAIRIEWYQLIFFFLLSL